MPCMSRGDLTPLSMQAAAASEGKRSNAMPLPFAELIDFCQTPQYPPTSGQLQDQIRACLLRLPPPDAALVTAALRCLRWSATSGAFVGPAVTTAAVLAALKGLY
jgi:hypothetical protein